jgi:hypothetical protein
MLGDKHMAFLVVKWEDHLTAGRVDGMRVWGGILSKSLQMLEPRMVRLI